MKRILKVLATCLAGGLLLTVVFVFQASLANANFPEITFAPFCETVTLSITAPLPISVLPNWSQLGNYAGYRLYYGTPGAGNQIFGADIYKPNSLSTSLSADITPCGEYTHWAEIGPFIIRTGPFSVDRGQQF